MSAIYQCEALEKKDEFLRLRVHIINPEYPVFYYSKSFVLNLLFDYSDPTKSDSILASPLYQTIPRYAPEPCNYFLDLKDEIVSEVTVEEELNYPVTSPLDVHDYRAQLDQLPACVFGVLLTDAKWAAHVEVNRTWTSGAADCEDESPL